MLKLIDIRSRKMAMLMKNYKKELSLLKEDYNQVLNQYKENKYDLSGFYIRREVVGIVNIYVELYIPDYPEVDDFDRLNALILGNYIDSSSADILHKARKIGNSAAHRKAIKKMDIEAVIAPLNQEILKLEKCVETKQYINKHIPEKQPTKSKLTVTNSNSNYSYSNRRKSYEESIKEEEIVNSFVAAILGLFSLLFFRLAFYLPGGLALFGVPLMGFGVLVAFLFCIRSIIIAVRTIKNAEPSGYKVLAIITMIMACIVVIIVSAAIGYAVYKFIKFFGRF